MIRRAQRKDVQRLGELLAQVALVHHEGRPDLFNKGRKYSDEELIELLKDESRPILVFADEEDTVQGYCFCVLQRHKDHGVLTDVGTLYVDDLCVDETCRGKHMGKALYEAAKELAVQKGCYNLTLNVYACNSSAMGFYEAMGMQVQKIGMEVIL